MSSAVSHQRAFAALAAEDVRPLAEDIAIPRPAAVPQFGGAYPFPTASPYPDGHGTSGSTMPLPAVGPAIGQERSTSRPPTSLVALAAIPDSYDRQSVGPATIPPPAFPVHQSFERGGAAILSPDNDFRDGYVSGTYPVSCPRAQDYSSGVRATWRPVETEEVVAAAAFIAATAMGLERGEDSVQSAHRSIGTSALRAAAWLRTRGIAIGHAVSKRRLQTEDADLYELAAETPVAGRKSRGALRFGRMESAHIARWMRDKDGGRVAVIFVGPNWAGCRNGKSSALVAVRAGHYALTLFDPTGMGTLERVRFDELDEIRATGLAHGEVLLCASQCD